MNEMELTCCKCLKKRRFKNRDMAIDAGWTILKASTGRARIQIINCPECFSTDMLIEMLKGGK